jgi:cell division protein FtsB
VNDVTKSREKWRAQAEQLQEELNTLQAENDALREQVAGLKKTGVADA